jgi:hypothetical protein
MNCDHSSRRSSDDIVSRDVPNDAETYVSGDVKDLVGQAACIHASGDVSCCNFRSNLDHLCGGYLTRSCSSFFRTLDHSHLHDVAVER